MDVTLSERSQAHWLYMVRYDVYYIYDVYINNMSNIFLHIHIHIPIPIRIHIHIHTHTYTY